MAESNETDASTGRSPSCKMQFVVTERFRDRLHAQADREERTMTDIVVKEVGRYLDRKERQQ